MKIVLVNSLTNNKTQPNFSIGLLSLATILRKQGYNVEIIDVDYLYAQGVINKTTTSLENISLIADCILKTSPDLIGFHTLCSFYHNTIVIAKYIKEKKPEIPIILGGPQASLTAISSLKAFPWIDLIVVGEAEKTIEKVIMAFSGNEVFSNISGIVYREGDSIQETEAPELCDLNELLPLDYSLIPYLTECNPLPIEVGRGCPFNCIYCSTKVFWKRKYRLKNINHLLSEIVDLYRNYNISTFSFIHDLFTVDQVKVIDFCNLLIANNLPIQWRCSARIDTLNEVLIRKMKQAGCKGIYLGIETGSPRMQELIHKGLSLSSMWDTVNMIKGNDIEVTLSLIYGFPEETYEDVRQTLSLILIALQNRILNVQLHLCTILAGTELYQNYADQLHLAHSHSDMATDLNLDLCQDLIENNPDIFPHFYEFSSTIRSNLSYLDQFINYVFSKLYENYEDTFRYILDYYNNDLLEFFVNFKSHVPEFSTGLFGHHTIFYNNKSVQNLYHTSISLLERFVFSFPFGKFSMIIREMFLFETDIVRFSQSQQHIIQEFSYQVNVLTAKSESLSVEHIDQRPVQLQFFCFKGINNNVKIRELNPPFTE